MNFRSTRVMICLIVSCIFASPCFSVVYVDQNAPGPGHDGTTWDTAFLTIQEGVDAATPGGEVWVADGVYVENVVMGEGVQLYGGFLGAEPGGYEDSLDQRDYVNNIATMDGSQSGSCVVMAVSTRVDGFTITNGSGTLDPYGEMRGGGFYCRYLGSTGSIANNVISGNAADESGGGIYCWESSPAVTNNTITGNSAGDSGGGMHCNGHSSPSVVKNDINTNSAVHGGGVACEWYASPVMIGNSITGNSARYGGGVHCYYGTAPTLADSIIANNRAEYLGGGVAFSYGWLTVLDGNTILHNSAASGGGVVCQSSSLALTNNIIAGNSAGDKGGGMFCYNGSDAALTGNTVSGNCAVHGGGIYCWCSSVTLASNAITGNSARESGAGIYCYSASSALATNNTMAGNLAPSGAAVACDSHEHRDPSQVVMANCVLWSAGGEVWNNDSSSITITYSDVEGGWPGEGNLDADPLFVDPDNGDFHLSPESPCIDAGWNDAPGLPEEDFEGDPRIIWAMKFPVPYWPHPGYVDIGADEYVPPGALRRGWPGLRRLPAGQATIDRGQMGGTPGR